MLTRILACALLALPAAADPPTRPDIRDFRPSQHGFHFVNHFTGPAVDLGGMSNLFPGSGSYGLCGGMAMTAADAYLAGAPLPDNTTAPARGTPQHSWIYQRQSASLGWWGWNGLRIARFVTMTEPSAHAANADQLARIRDRLAVGEPAPLCLIYRPAWENAALWENHQVLGYNAVDRPDGSVDIRVYDSNYPHHDGVVVRFSPAEGAGFTAQRIVPGRRGTRPVHAVILMHYTPRPVPADL
ncbi:MAG: hypothetical protein ACF8SC_06365 [Phycisphaerales bacterium JB037]